MYACEHADPEVPVRNDKVAGESAGKREDWKYILGL